MQRVAGSTDAAVMDAEEAVSKILDTLQHTPPPEHRVPDCITAGGLEIRAGAVVEDDGPMRLVRSMDQGAREAAASRAQEAAARAALARADGGNEAMYQGGGEEDGGELVVRMSAVAAADLAQVCVMFEIIDNVPTCVPRRRMWLTRRVQVMRLLVASCMGSPVGCRWCGRCNWVLWLQRASARRWDLDLDCQQWNNYQNPYFAGHKQPWWDNSKSGVCIWLINRVWWHQQSVVASSSCYLDRPPFARQSTSTHLASV